ncbi:MAG: nucleotide sugar dehydrogenase [Candidatus Niameybacter stercoravium]|nr:nucleotide sugar dehydrogenase [Candidatus Niameybacter stercoravium]
MVTLLEEKILNKNASIGIIGLGYVGLPLAVALALTQYQVIGIDKSKEKIKKLQEKESYIIDVPSEKLEKVMQNFLTVSSDYALIQKMDVIIICVPTPLTDSKEPDTSYISQVVDEIITYIKVGTLVILESTTYPGTTDYMITSRIERERGFKIGEDFFVCYSPERVDPGNAKYQVTNTPKVIGGATANCLKLGELLYKSFIEKVVCVSSNRVAEFVKLLENTFRSINIAWINEMAMMCDVMGINIWEVIDAASTKPFGFMSFHPGPGIGGHCIPLDPMYLSWEGKKYNFYNRFIELASDINSNMPRFTVKKAQKILNDIGEPIKNTKILLVGMSYKKDVDDLRESPAIEVYQLLKESGAQITYYDPYISKFTLKGEEVCSVALDEQAMKENSLIIIITGHTCINYETLLEQGRLIFDTQNVLSHYKSTEVWKKHHDKIKVVGGE